MDQEIKQQIHAVFSQEIEPVKTAFLYKIGLFLVACVMLLLPAIYLLIVAALGYGVFYHATRNITVFENPYFRVALLIYIAPLLAGAVLFVYMAKPLLPKWGKRLMPLYTDY